MDLKNIKQFRNPAPDKMIIYLVVIYIVGIVGMLVESTRTLFIFLVPLNILGATAIVGLYHKPYSIKFLFTCFMIYVGGYLIEWIGIKTGVIFGEYEYGEGLGFRVDGVPPIMGVNWLLLVYSVTHIIRRITMNKWLIAALGASLMVIYDLFLEPAAINYNFWDWHTDTIPIQNYIAWWIGGFVFISYLNFAITNWTKNPLAEAIFWLQLIFFVCLYLGNNFIP